MKITKENLSEIDHIEFGLENCEAYAIAPESIIDILFDEFELNVGKRKYNKANNGRMVLSKNMFHQLTVGAVREMAYDAASGHETDEEYYFFYNRITSWCDIVSVEIHYKNGRKFEFYVEYDPIINYLCGCDVEYSNCPTAELDENGDMLILFGKSSRSPKRIDDDYYNIIEGFGGLFKKRVIGTLSVEIEMIGNGGVNCWNPDNGLYAELRIKNMEHRNCYLPLEFFDVTELTFFVDIKNATAEDFNISPTADGRLFVQFGAKCNFYCKRIKVFEGF